jgi:hypothetical protein
MSVSDSMTHSMSFHAYEYAPLENEEIRLITLYPVMFSDEIHLTLHHEILNLEN